MGGIFRAGGDEARVPFWWEAKNQKNIFGLIQTRFFPYSSAVNGKTCYLHYLNWLYSQLWYNANKYTKSKLFKRIKVWVQKFGSKKLALNVFCAEEF